MKINETLTIAEVATHTGLTAHTLRYYERAGLISAVPRTTGGQRRYAASDLAWIAFLLRLRDTGMSIADMREFATLRAAGPSTAQARLDLLARHRRQVKEHIGNLRRNARELDKKIQYYTELAQSAPDEETPP